ncbi:MAG: TetR/AcrR family transcriptional regulator [Desulfobacterales bacterium]|nr:TetR/AcrR family transcriptional regulator [Desulfobacterales bacterium]
MPKNTRSEQEIDAVRERILDHALDILIHNGLDCLSMSKIGSRMKMTAANLYNYYSNKNELLIAMHKKAYNLLYEKLSTAADNEKRKDKKLRILLDAFVNFGIKNPELYDLMFNRMIPQNSDYIGTPQEKSSKDEFKSSLKSLHLATNIVMEHFADNNKITEKEVKLIIIKIFGKFHGLISLYNSGILKEIDENPRKLIDEIVRECLLS